jgi:uncharacterized protein
MPGWPAAFELDITPEIRQRLVHTDTRELEHHLANSETQFLGSYFEALWAFFLSHEPRFDVVAKNLQVHDGQRTIGEFDFIVFDRHVNIHLHLELAIKFYLGVSETSSLPYTDGEHLWIGPQARDRLDRKVARALDHQLVLHKHPAAQKQLQALGVTTVEPQLLFKGYLFQPKNALPLPDYVSPAKGDAFWLSLDDMRGALNTEKSWHVLEKRHWPAPPYTENIDNPLTVDELVEKLNDLVTRENRPYMIVRVDRSSPSGLVLERYFVTPEDWPYHLGGASLN